MRDIVVTLIVFGSIPLILKRPWIGVLVWSWLSYMNPHRLAFGFAYTFPFAYLVALTTLTGIVFYRGKKSIPITPVTVCWGLFVLWMCLTTYLAANPEGAMTEWIRTMKIQLIVFITLLLIRERVHIDALVWTIVVSLGFFGARGGVFSLATGGQFHVMGPPESFIAENNTLGLALIMTLPLMRYLQLNTTNKRISYALLGLIGLTALSILTSQSRGAFLAGSVMVVFLIMKSRQRFRLLLLTVVALPLMLIFMPDAWFDRMSTISEYQSDASAMGRVNAWYMAFNLVLDHPVTGAGFQAFTPEAFELYAPDPDDYHDAHSIYFEVLAEHGFVGLALFLGIGVLTFLTGSRIIARTREHESLHWARDLAGMLQVSLLGYSVGGAFLGLAYYDLVYHLVVIMVITNVIVSRELKDVKAGEPAAPKGVADTAKVPAWRRRAAIQHGRRQ